METSIWEFTNKNMGKTMGFNQQTGEQLASIRKKIGENVDSVDQSNFIKQPKDSSELRPLQKNQTWDYNIRKKRRARPKAQFMVQQTMWRLRISWAESVEEPSIFRNRLRESTYTWMYKPWFPVDVPLNQSTNQSGGKILSGVSFRR
jgi:hypothetical protein